MIIYASRNGRLKLLIKRIFILLLFIFTFVIVNYGVISSIALFRYGGIENVFNSAASSLELQLCSYGANRMLYLLIVCIQNTFAFFAWAVMMWGILNLFKNKNVGIVAVIIINLIEMLLYRLIDVKSIYRFLRYTINLDYDLGGEETGLDILIYIIYLRGIIYGLRMITGDIIHLLWIQRNHNI